VWTTELPGQYLSEAGNRWVAVVATVRNTSDAGVLGGTLQAALTLTDVEGLVEKPGVVPGVTSTSIAVLEDGSSLSPVQPGLTYEAAFLFEQAGTAAPPTSATVQLQRQTWRAGLDPSAAWSDATTTLRAQLDVREAVSDAEADS
jgi:hypothetical protein